MTERLFTKSDTKNSNVIPTTEVDAELTSQLAGNKNEGPSSHPTCRARAIRDSFGIEDDATHITQLAYNS